VKLVFDTPSRLHHLLETNKLDVCFSIYPERDSKLIESKPIYREELVLVAPQGQLSERASFQEVIASPMVEYYFNHQPIRRWLALHFKKKPKHLPIRTFAATAEMVLSLIQEGLGIGVVPEYLLQTRSPKTVSICRPTLRKLMDNIWMLQLKRAERSTLVAAFNEEILAATF
jgi:DNA-binding transcriptional LysR family regulator